MKMKRKKDQDMPPNGNNDHTIAVASTEDRLVAIAAGRQNNREYSSTEKIKRGDKYLNIVVYNYWKVQYTPNILDTCQSSL